MMQELTYVRTAKDICVPILSGELYEDSKHESVEEVLKKLADLRFE